MNELTNELTKGATSKGVSKLEELERNGKMYEVKDFHYLRVILVV